jgi:predicted transcriptional regulator
MDEELLQSLIQLLKEKGFDVSRLQRTNHDCAD